jgi:hypothetical protein
LPGLVEYEIDEVFAGLLVGVGEHIGRDLDQRRFQIALVPGLEDSGDLVRGLRPRRSRS